VRERGLYLEKIFKGTLAPPLDSFYLIASRAKSILAHCDQMESVQFEIIKDKLEEGNSKPNQSFDNVHRFWEIDLA
jgi:hypothetical protein